MKGAEEEEELVHYVVKREFSEGSLHIKSFSFPTSALRLQEDSPELDFRLDCLNDLPRPQSSSSLIAPSFRIEASCCSRSEASCGGGL